MSELLDLLSLDMTVVISEVPSYILCSQNLLVLNAHRPPENFGCMEKIISKCFLMSFR